MNIKQINLKIVIPVFIMAIISILTIYSAMTYTSSELGNLALRQGLWYGIGVLLVLFLLRMKNEYLYRHTIFLYVLGNILLVGLLLFAEPVNNSKCWFTIPGIGSIQPSEFMKIFLMMMLATMIHNFRSDYKNPSLQQEFIFILKTFLVVLIPSVLTFLQPDTGAVLIYFIIYFCMMFASGIRIRWFIIAGVVLLLLLAGIFGIYFFKQDLFIDIFGTDLFYRFERIFSWRSGTGLQLENALAAIGSSGLFGHGFNQTPIYFPESSTDFIFAVFASNFGLIGSLALLFVIIYFDVQIIMLAKRKIVDTDKYILAGILGMLLFQQIQNIGMTVGLFPITGITLPFISYGGSSLLSYMILLGIILNISMEKARHYKYK